MSRRVNKRNFGVMMSGSSAAGATREDRLQTLPDAVASHLTGMLTMRDFLQLRGTNTSVYERVVFMGEPMACIARLRPGVIRRILEQRGAGRLRYLGLRLSFPPTPEEVATLEELRGIRGIKTLELRFEFNQEVLNLTPEDFVHERAYAALVVMREVMALGLESLAIVCDYLDEIGNSEAEEMFAACILANRTTLRHLSMPGPQSANIDSLDTVEIANVLLRLETLRVDNDIAGVTHNCDACLPPNPNSNPEGKPFHIPSVAVVGNRAPITPAWRYLNVLLKDSRSMFVNRQGSMRVPACLPDTLEGLSLTSTANVKWTCPPRLEFLHVLTDSCACVMYASIPPNHATLTCLIVGLYPSCDFYAEPQHGQAYEDWLTQVSLPSLETLSIYGNLGERDFLDVAHLIARLPHLRRLYINSPNNADPSKNEMDLESKRLCLNMLEAGLLSNVQFECDVPAPDLEAQFLMEHGLSILSPCTTPHAIVEEGTRPGETSRFIHLQPAPLPRRNNVRRRT
jgi:hypothetical protein